MKKFGLVIIGAITAAILGGCVVANNGKGGTLTEEEKNEIDENLDETKGILDSVFDEVKASLDEDMEEVNWAEELFEDYDHEKSEKPLKITKIKAEDAENTDGEEQTTDSEEIVDVAGFIDGIRVKEWTKIGNLPVNLEPEYIFLVEQPATDTVLQDNSGKFTEIARITLYKDSDYADIKVLGGLEYEEFMKMMPEGWFVSSYELPEDISVYLRG